MLLFPLDGLLDEQACHDWLLHCLHPEELSCPRGHRLPEGQRPHDRHRAPVMDYRCRQCGAVYNLFTGTLLTGVRWPCSTLVLMLRGFAQGTPTKHLAQELNADRAQMLAWRHRTQALLAERLPPLGPARCGGGGRRVVPERGREGAGAPGPR